MPSVATTTARIPAQRSRRGRQPAPVLPLGSLTQEGSAGPSCGSCGSAQVTRLALTLTDGTPVTFVSCHRCEARRWEHAGAELSVDTVLDRTRKLA